MVERGEVGCRVKRSKGYVTCGGGRGSRDPSGGLQHKRSWTVAPLADVGGDRILNFGALFVTKVVMARARGVVWTKRAPRSLVERTRQADTSSVAPRVVTHDRLRFTMPGGGYRLECHSYLK